MLGWMKKVRSPVRDSRPVPSALNECGLKDPPTSVFPDYKFLRNPDVIAQRAKEETMLFNMETGQYYSLNDIGARIWELSDGTRTPDQLATVIEGEYVADHAMILADILALAADLMANGLLIEPRDVGPPG